MLGEKCKHSTFLYDLGVETFKERFPWFGGDLQTLRDTFRRDTFFLETKTESIEIPVPKIPSGQFSKGSLLAFLDYPFPIKRFRGLVLLLHGLGGSSERNGLKRMGFSLQKEGFAVLRLNLRGAYPGRHLVGGTYAADCSSDLIPVIIRARELCKNLKDKLDKDNDKEDLPVLGVGISLGGTILLNACLKESCDKTIALNGFLLDGLICTSSPLDLRVCSKSIERFRNCFYQNWLLRRLVIQTISDPFGVLEEEQKLLRGKNNNIIMINSIKEFDSIITAPRWGYSDVNDYYLRASPIKKILSNHDMLPPTLLVQSLDDPWVPSKPAEELESFFSLLNKKELKVLLTSKGGHNGFHSDEGCWGDKVVLKWFEYLGF